MEPVPVLNVVEGALTGQQFEVTTAGLCIGREPSNEIVVADGGVSRQHARVLLHNGTVWVQDVGSRNGVFVNGARVPDHKQVKPGDKILVGQHLFVLSMQPKNTSGTQFPIPPPPPDMASSPSKTPLMIAGAIVGLLLLAILGWLVAQG